MSSKKLFRNILSDNIDFYNYGIFDINNIFNLLGMKDFNLKRFEALKQIEEIISENSKKPLLKGLIELSEVETGIKILQPKHRDHVVHSLQTYLLGIYFNEIFLQKKVDYFQWKIAGLFHDVGYPIQISARINQSYSKVLNKITRVIGIKRPELYFETRCIDLEKLNISDTLKLIQIQIDKWQLKIDVTKEYQDMIKTDKICHGILGAMSVLYCIDNMYQLNNPNREYRDIFIGPSNWNQKFFNEDIIPACSAIYLHNLPKECFLKSKINCEIAPVAFLLKLSDTLQEWERPSGENVNGYSASLFNFDVEDSILYYKAKILESDKDRIKADLNILDEEKIIIE